MIRTITTIKDYSFNPKLESKQELYNTPINLFGNTWRIIDDYWMKHVHIKITDKCDAHCPFCIEKSSHIRENKIHLFRNLSSLLTEMNQKGHLTTISITGGEPSLCSYVGEVVDFVKTFPVFLNINTNFHRTIKSSSDPDWINISRHIIGKDEYTGINALDVNLLNWYREKHPKTKIRLQCVLHPNGLQNIEDVVSFMEHYHNYVDDLSFRRLINTTDEFPKDDLFQQLKYYLYNNFEFVEQVLKDYYVYETWKYKGTDVTLSHSNMKLLKNLEQTEDERILREIIVHPDGLISGSWYRNKKIIAR